MNKLHLEIIAIRKECYVEGNKTNDKINNADDIKLPTDKCNETYERSLIAEGNSCLKLYLSTVELNSFFEVLKNIII